MSNVIASVKALIHYQNSYLVLKEAFGGCEVWDLPGGKIEFGETPYEALKREVMEEVCLGIEIKKLVGVWWFYTVDQINQVICHTFLCEPVEEVVVDLSKNPANEVITNYFWVSKQDLLNESKYQWPESLKEIIRNIPE